MNALILAAGYATRLYPLTLTKAKPLLEVAGKPMIEWVLDNLAPVGELEKVYIVTNDKFARDFETWANQYMSRHSEMKLIVINDGSTSDSDKLGAIGDIELVLNRGTLSDDDLMVVAGDNLFSEPLDTFARKARKTKATLATYDVGNLEVIRKYSCISTDARGIVTKFEEKPAHPETTIAGIALYYYSRETLPLFKTYLSEGNNPDQPGRFVQWLHTRVPVQACEIHGTWFDIGSKETLEEANELFQQFRK